MADRAGRTQERQRLGATTFTQAFDGAWHPTSLTSSWVAPPIHPSTIFSTASSNGYFPTGQIHLATFGNGLTETNVYNNRLQPCRLNLNASATVLTNCSDRSPSTGNLLDFTNGFNWGTSDNGNVVSWNASGQQSFTRSFQYDSLNRLQQLTEAGGNAESCKPSSSSTNLYTISWTVDAWGNRTNQTPSQGTCSFSQAVNAKNQFVAGSYDAA